MFSVELHTSTFIAIDRQAREPQNAYAQLSPTASVTLNLRAFLLLSPIVCDRSIDRIVGHSRPQLPGDPCVRGYGRSSSSRSDGQRGERVIIAQRSAAQQNRALYGTAWHG